MEHVRLPPRRWLRGLNLAVSGNARSFGYSITITVTYGVVSSKEGNPSLPELFGFALAAVAAFSLLNLAVAGLLRREQPSSDPAQVILVATATDFLAVGCAIATAVGVRVLLSGWGAWVLAPFIATLAYVLVQVVEIAVGLRETARGE